MEIGVHVPASVPSGAERCLPRALSGLNLSATPEPSGCRDRIWELFPNLHCSIIRICLSTAALRQRFGRLNHADAKTASDHALRERLLYCDRLVPRRAGGWSSPSGSGISTFRVSPGMTGAVSATAISLVCPSIRRTMR